LHKT
jgi:hypothetical protein